ncbi:DoxX family protein [Terriglobus aquaticus]|uniref:DoxX family protein n=1 Tax=Terriglobus aquaticus TaxID=940139 RepID=A0ABW9KLJ4_9BACT
MSEDQRNRSWAYVLLRVMLGVNMAFHGISRIIAGPGVFAATLVHGFQNTILPTVLVRAFALTLPWAEAAVGLLILVGLFRLPALLAGGAMLVALTFGSTLRQDWESAGLQLIYALVYAALLAFLSHDRYAVDLVLWRPAWRAR